MIEKVQTQLGFGDFLIGRNDHGQNFFTENGVRNPEIYGIPYPGAQDVSQEEDYLHSRDGSAG